MPLGEGVLTNEGRKKGTHLKGRHFTAIGVSSVKTVADRHRHAAYHDKQ